MKRQFLIGVCVVTIGSLSAFFIHAHFNKRNAAPTQALEPFEERIPEHVAAAVSNRLAVVFGNENVTGVPLVDPKIDWNNLNNWPYEFSFRGETYRLVIYENRVDYGIDLKSKTDVKPGMRIYAGYHTEGLPITIFSATWDQNGSIENKTVIFQDIRVLVFWYYPSGRLRIFSTDDVATGRVRTEYFDKSGKMVEAEIPDK